MTYLIYLFIIHFYKNSYYQISSDKVNFQFWVKMIFRRDTLTIHLPVI